ncbi:TPA: phytanoyl-CoA dioxygenase [Candidatus Poribacteria bacterium]|nr:phytanoyl-CoA dioxygenase [Candidatus Poribacteria bacterium]HIB90325.1 phytanoyl-CoA dioxygenase [Candidatus Poribacteria bacterium]
MDTDKADLFQQFISNGFVLIPKVISSKLLTQVSADIDDVLGENPPELGTVGPYFPPINKPESLMPLLLQTSVFTLAESFVGKGKLLVLEQVQLALNIPYFPHRPSRHHLDGVSIPEADGRPGTFTLLVGILITDQPRPDMGNLWVWPGTHLTHANFFRHQGIESLMASGGSPDIWLPDPIQIVGQAGDLLLAHYLLAHNIGGNRSDKIRRAVYFRLQRSDHRDHWQQALQDPWYDFDGIRAYLQSKNLGT